MKRIAIRFLPLILGVYTGVALIMTIDIEIRMSLINMNDPSSFPNMHPYIGFYFIPIVGTFLTVVVIVIELIRSIVWETHISQFLHWFILGLSYTTFLSVLPLVCLMPLAYAYAITAIIVLFINPIIIHIIVKPPGRGLYNQEVDKA